MGFSNCALMRGAQGSNSKSKFVLCCPPFQTFQVFQGNNYNHSLSTPNISERLAIIPVGYTIYTFIFEKIHLEGATTARVTFFKWNTHVHTKIDRGWSVLYTNVSVIFLCWTKKLYRNFKENMRNISRVWGKYDSVSWRL